MSDSARKLEGRALRLQERLYAHYAAHARAPARLEELSIRAPYLRALIARHFPPAREARVLDVGCGHGALVHFARQAGYLDVRGIDVSEAQVAAARALGIGGIEAGDLLEGLRRFPDESLDVVVAFDVIEHFSKDELLDFVDEVRRVLAPGGRWILHAPNGESPLFGRVLHGDLTHQLAFTQRSLRQLLLASGYSSCECFEDAPVVSGARSLVRALLWRAFRSLLRLYLAAETGNPGRDAVFTQNLLAVAHR